MHQPLAFCHELFGDRSFDEQCCLLKKIGYDGIELAPFCLANDLRTFTPSDANRYRQIVTNYGLKIPAMHWLLRSPQGMHITTPDKVIYRKTCDFFRVVLEKANSLGVEILVFGNPQQRTILPEWNHHTAYEQGVQFFYEMGDIASDLGITIAFEPLGPALTNFGGSLSDAIKLIEYINHPAVKIHLDVSAMYRDPLSWMDQIRLVGINRLVYVHLNDPNQLGPGMGDIDFKPILQTFSDIGYKGWYSIEPFRTDIPAEIIARESFNYLNNMVF